MDSCNDDQKQTALSKEDLRLRRLIAFGILQPQNISVDGANANTEPPKSNETYRNTDETTKAPTTAVTKKRTHSEIISLLDSSSDSEVEICSSKSRTTKALVSSLESGYITPTGQIQNSRMMNDSASWKPKIYGAVDTSLDAFASRQTDGRSKPWKFKVATWNVWFGPQGDGEPHPAVRMRTLLRLLAEQSSNDCPLLFIGFQEVIDELAVSLIPALDCAGYRVYRQPDAAYGCAVAVDKRLEVVDHSWHPYTTTVMQRGFYHVRAKLPDSSPISPEVIFATTHLESWTGSSYTGAAQRILQLQEMERFCNTVVSPQVTKQKGTPAAVAIMTGDMNWDDDRLRSSNNLDPIMSTVLREPDRWRDVWSTIMSTDASKSLTTDATKGYTYDAKMNPMLGGNLRRRFDRCLVRSSLDLETDVANAVLLGKDPIPGITWQKLNPYKRTYKTTPTAPSDHFGLVAEFEVSIR